MWRLISGFRGKAGRRRSTSGSDPILGGFGGEADNVVEDVLPVEDCGDVVWWDFMVLIYVFESVLGS